MMTVFKRKSIYVAVLAGLGAVGVAGTASAVHVNPDGLGQALIYPYFTVRTAGTAIATGSYNTYISVTNTTNSAKAVKVRFLEGKGSAEVLDFNLFLSAHDMWTGWIEPTATGAILKTDDQSCTTGVIPVAGQPFSNGAYTGTGADGEDASLDRSREGYFELIEMGTIFDGGAGSVSRDLLNAVTHATSGADTGLPPCNSTNTTTRTAAQAVLNTADAAGLTGYLNYAAASTGGLMGTASLVNPSTGVDYTFDAVALEAWNFAAIGTKSTVANPSLSGGTGGLSAWSEVIASNVGVGVDGFTLREASWPTGLPALVVTPSLQAVSAALMHNNIINEYVLDAGTISGTDWVVTFPTKRLYLGTDSLTLGVRNRTATAGYPFNENFGLGGSCDTITMNQYDREEQTTIATGGFSPTTTSTFDLCWEANVISFNQTSATSAILGSKNVLNTNVSYQHGWMELGLNHGAYPINGGKISNTILTPTSSYHDTIGAAGTYGAYLLAGDGRVYRGLPAVGFMVQDFVNSTLVTGTGATPGAAFGGNFVHKYTRWIGL